VALRVDLGNSGLSEVRMTSDAVWETVASLQVLSSPRQHAIHTRLRRMVPDRPRSDLGFLLGLVAHRGWFPDAVSPIPRLDPPSPREQFELLRGTDPAVLQGDLEVLARLSPELKRMSPQEYADRVSRELFRYWQEVLEPIWEDVDAVTTEDLAFHSRQISREGLARAMSGIHHEVGYADGTLEIGFHYTDRDADRPPEGVWLVPSAFRWPWIAGRYGGPLIISYAARGAARVWEREYPARGADALAALLGRSRAAILQRLQLPRSTTWLARDIGLSPGTVSDHLTVMTESGLLTSRRDGRRVLYVQTALGADLAAGGPQAWSVRA
jgi:hypothetical protein